MNCPEFETRLAPYIDGELGVSEALAAGAHLADCPRCRSFAEREQRFRRLLRRQPRESAPPDSRTRIIGRCRRAARWARVRPWLLASGLALVALLVNTLLLPRSPQSTPVVGDLVAAHIAFAEIEHPAEFASEERAEVEAWFQQRARLGVTVADYSPAGIRLVGGRIAAVRGRPTAYVLYAKGHTLLSVFVRPISGQDTHLAGTGTTYRGQEYFTRDQQGIRTVSWTDEQALFGLVSTLDYEALLECADRLREARASQRRL